MSAQPIQATIDAYGTYARASNLADHLELSCLLGRVLSRTDLADLINDRAWVAKMQEHFEGPAPEVRSEFDDPPEEDEAATTDEPGTVQADRVFNVLVERSELLGDQYPFEVEDQLTLRAGVEPRECPYIGLLSITIAHAHGIQAPHEPTQVLEAVVVEVLKTKGLRAVDVAATSREGGTFGEIVRKASEAVALRALPESVITMTHANDEGVDVLGHLPAGDLRVGAWAFLGQATCEKSDGWPAKIREPSVEMWKTMLNLGAQPFAFLAVPHHVERKQFTKLVRDETRLIFDRIRLAFGRDTVSDEEAAIVDAVLGAGVEQIA
jgi:hypothetical protein